MMESRIEEINRLLKEKRRQYVIKKELVQQGDSFPAECSRRICASLAADMFDLEEELVTISKPVIEGVEKQAPATGTGGKAKDFVSSALNAYAGKHGTKPSALAQLLNFAKGSGNPVIGYVVTVTGKGNGRMVEFGDGNGSVTYRAASKAFSELNK